jgi:hypothetical protein
MDERIASIITVCSDSIFSQLRFPIPVTLMMEAIGSSEMSLLTSATRCHIQEERILRSRRRENLKSYVALTGWSL